MRAYVVNEWVHPSQLKLVDDAPEPEAAGSDEILVDVYSSGLNFFDVRYHCLFPNCFLIHCSYQILQAQGKYQVKPPFPFILGAEFAGKVAKGSPVPKGCPYKPGDRVFGTAQGCFADKVAAKWQSVNPLPDNLTFDQGAGTSRCNDLWSQ